MVLDWTVNIGHIITLVAFMFGGIWVFFGIRYDVANLSKRLSAVEDGVKKLTEVLLLTTEQRALITGIADRLDRLERQFDHNGGLPR